MDILKKITETLQDRLGISDKAYLYGSRATGKAREDSDWDILILLDKDRISKEDYDSISYPLVDLGWGIDQNISPVLYTVNEWSKQALSPFFRNVHRDAIRLI